MRRLAWLAIGACAAQGAAPTPVPPLPVALPCGLTADGGRAYGFRTTLERRLEEAQAHGPGGLAALFAEGAPPAGGPVATIVTCPDAPFLLGDGLFTDLTAGNQMLRGAYATWGDGWQVHLVPPRDAFDSMRVLDTRAELWMSIARRWATIDVSLDAVVTGDDRRLVLAAPPLEAPVTDPGAPLHDGFRLVVATVDGEPADVVLGAGGYLVLGGVPAGLARVTLRYEGPLPLVGDNQAEASVLELHRWLPSLPYGAPQPLTITVHHPAEDTLVASMWSRPLGDDPALAGWREELVTGTSDRDPSLLLLDHPAAVQRWSGGGARIDLLASPPVPIDDCAPALAQITDALAPLGSLGDVRLLAVPTVFGRHGRRAGDLIVILREKLVDLCTRVDARSPVEILRRHAQAIELVAHELAHGWFGRDVRAADDEAGMWWEAAAEYVSSWAVGDAAAAELRRGWLDDYGDQEERDRVALAARVATAGELRDALSYDKGALLLTALEDRIGRARMVAVLRALIAERRGHLGSWLDLVTVTHELAGSDAATWLHGWLVTAGAPRIGLTADRASATITCAPPFVVTVQLVAFAGPRALASWDVPLAGTRTTIAIAVPPEADRLVVDPYARVPRYGLAEVALRPAVVLRGR